MESHVVQYVVHKYLPEGVELARELIANAEGSDSWAVEKVLGRFSESRGSALAG